MLLKELLEIAESRTLEEATSKPIKNIKGALKASKSVNGNVTISVEYDDYPSIASAEEKSVFKDLKDAAKAISGKVERVKETFGSFTVTASGVTPEKMAGFFNEIEGRFNEEGYGDAGDDWSWTFSIN